MNQEIATIDNQPLAPLALEAGKATASALMDIVNNSEAKVVIKIGQKDYLKVEGWEFIGKADNTYAVTDWVSPIYEDEELVAYEARVKLVKEGQDGEVGGAISECGLDSFVTQNAKGRDKHNAAKSMAQTRAASKAFRMKYSWVAVLAGYEATPAEEMQTVRAEPDKSSENYCAEHDTEWFMRGKMKDYAHPPKEDGGEWCRKPSAKTPSPEPQEAESAPQLPRQPIAMDKNAFTTACADLGLTKDDLGGMYPDGFPKKPYEELLADIKVKLQPTPPEDLPW